MGEDFSSIFKIPKSVLIGSPIKKNNNRKVIGKPLRNTIWMKYLGNRAQGKCYCCKIRPIHYSDFQVGHNKAVSKGGKNNISNLRPICGPCNRGMSTGSIEAYRKKHFTRPSHIKQSASPVKRVKRQKNNLRNANLFSLGTLKPSKNPFGL